MPCCNSRSLSRQVVIHRAICLDWDVIFSAQCFPLESNASSRSTLFDPSLRFFNYFSINYFDHFYFLFGENNAISRLARQCQDLGGVIAVSISRDGVSSSQSRCSGDRWIEKVHLCAWCIANWAERWTIRRKLWHRCFNPSRMLAYRNVVKLRS